MVVLLYYVVVIVIEKLGEPEYETNYRIERLLSQRCSRVF